MTAFINVLFSSFPSNSKPCILLYQSWKSLMHYNYLYIQGRPSPAIPGVHSRIPSHHLGVNIEHFKSGRNFDKERKKSGGENCLSKASAVCRKDPVKLLIFYIYIYEWYTIVFLSQLTTPNLHQSPVKHKFSIHHLLDLNLYARPTGLGEVYLLPRKNPNQL